MVHVPQTTQNLVISRYFVEDGKEMYKEQRTCTVILLLIKPFVTGDVPVAVVVVVFSSSSIRELLKNLLRDAEDNVD